MVGVNVGVGVIDAVGVGVGITYAPILLAFIKRLLSESLV